MLRDHIQSLCGKHHWNKAETKMEWGQHRGLVTFNQGKDLFKVGQS